MKLEKTDIENLYCWECEDNKYLYILELNPKKKRVICKDCLNKLKKEIENKVN